MTRKCRALIDEALAAPEICRCELCPGCKGRKRSAAQYRERIRELRALPKRIEAVRRLLWIKDIRESAPHLAQFSFR
jgi:transposase